MEWLVFGAPQLIRSGDANLTVTNFHDLLCIMCPDFQLRVVKSAFKAAWVVLRGATSLLLAPFLSLTLGSTAGRPSYG